ncbi:MAG: glycosyltransferase family 2 protein, partial [Chloroflexales bacterium]
MATYTTAISVVTVNFNHAAYLSMYIASLEASTYPIAEIIIVDNASTDNSLDVLRKYPHVRVIENHENIGYSAALNQAIRQATSSLVCATGPDIQVAPDWLEPLIDQYAQNPTTTFAVASRILTMDRRELQSAGGSLHFTGHLNVFHMWEKVLPEYHSSRESQQVGAVDSTSMLIDRAKFLTIGGCDPAFFVYHEEFDYCYRARMRGWTCWYHPVSVVFHGSGSAEFSVRSQGQYPRMRPYLHTRNRLLSILKNYQTKTLIAILPALFLVEVLNLLMLARLGLQQSYVDALIWLVRHWHDILLKR